MMASLPASYAPGAVPASAPRKRTYLSVRVRLAFGILLALLVALTALAASQLQGAAATAALVLGAAAILLAVATALWLLRSVVGPLGGATRAIERMGARDLSAEIEIAAAGELRPLLEGLQQVRERLSGVVNEVRTGTTNVAMNAAQITSDNQALSVRTETQAESLQETAASMEELTAAVRQTANIAQEADGLVRTASQRAEQGGAVMREVVQTMAAIRTSSHSIRDIIGVIDGIAFQTNILALNAAVEAARAGEQGRGFAVVAAEVRTLAQRSAAAAREIKDLITTAVDKVDGGGSRVDEAGRAMGEIVQAVRQVAELITHINSASQEQSGGIETVNLAVSRIDGTTQDNAAFVRQAARTAAALQERARTLLGAVQGFHIGVREHGTPEEAVALVERGCEFLRLHGARALIDDVNKLDSGRFVERDLYLLVLGVNDAVFVGHGNNPGRLGKGPEVRDVDGKCFPVEMARVARERGEGWVDYKWKHPVTGEVSAKRGYVRRAGELVIGCAATR